MVVAAAVTYVFARHESSVVGGMDDNVYQGVYMISLKKVTLRENDIKERETSAVSAKKSVFSGNEKIVTQIKKSLFSLCNHFIVNVQRY
jgi:hypothetical protein